MHLTGRKFLRKKILLEVCGSIHSDVEGGRGNLLGNFSARRAKDAIPIKKGTG